MSYHDTPPAGAGSWGRGRGPHRQSGLRIGDTERREVTDVLCRHLADGRLNEEEFHERVEQAAAAKTQADLDRLLSDLPRLTDHPGLSDVGMGSGTTPSDPHGGPPRRRRHGLGRTLLFVALALWLAGSVPAILWHGWWAFHPPIGLLVVGVAAWYFFRRRRCARP